MAKNSKNKNGWLYKIKAVVLLNAMNVNLAIILNTAMQKQSQKVPLMHVLFGVHV